MYSRDLFCTEQYYYVDNGTYNVKCKSFEIIGNTKQTLGNTTTKKNQQNCGG